MEQTANYINQSENSAIKLVYIREDIEELLTKKDLCERILHCDENTAERHYLNKPFFPYVNQGTRKRYPKKQVEEWIKKNTHYN